MGAALSLQSIGAAMIRANPEKKATGHLADGLSVMRIGDRVVMVDMTDYTPHGGEMVVFDHDGELGIEVPISVAMGSRPRAFTGEPRSVDGKPGSYGVLVLGRVVRDY